jgi:hypothetical protein
MWEKKSTFLASGYILAYQMHSYPPTFELPTYYFAGSNKRDDWNWREIDHQWVDYQQDQIHFSFTVCQNLFIVSNEQRDVAVCRRW